ncbi:MAG: endonuclease/exonuclease/phosphatase family protein [Beijerinckiaceae bacterium]
MTQTWRLATFNIESLDFRPAEPELFDRRLAALRPVLAGLDADIVCLQEVNAQKIAGAKSRGFAALKRLLAGTPLEAFFVATSVNPDTGHPADVHNLAILSRWPIAASGQIHHDLVAQQPVPPLGVSASQSNATALRWDRPTQTADISLPGGRLLHVVNLHLRAPRAVPFGTGRGRSYPGISRDWARGFYLAALKRQGQALEARLHLEEVFDDRPDALIAVCGDLNSDTYETPAKILRAAPDEADGALDPARSLEALESRVAQDRRFSVLHAGRPVLLDHILASPALAALCTGVDILNDGLADEFAADDSVAGSFHAPVVATFSAA